MLGFKSSSSSSSWSVGDRRSKWIARISQGKDRRQAVEFCCYHRETAEDDDEDEDEDEDDYT
jgi:hypothetical protein